jgi:hypothetical protein
MAYTIVKSDGNVLTTIPDGTINTSSTSLGLPGRNYAGYGQALDTNFVHLTENFADTTVPPNPLRGQLWCDTSGGTVAIKVCPADGTTNALAWLTLAATSSGGTTSFGAVTVTGNITSNNMTVTNEFTANSGSLSFLTVSANANIANANITSATIGTLTSTAITAGSQSTSGTLTGVWTANGSGTANGVNGTSMWVTGGNLVVSGTPGSNIGIRTDYYYYANGSPISFAGTYNNSNVQTYLATANIPILATTLQATTLTTGASGTAGTITGNWSLSSGSNLRATYADLAERFASDKAYDPGTVVQIGGTAEITAVQSELSDDVFGVVSNTAAYLMNDGAGDDETHPAIALVGRVKVKVTGTVNKGDRLVSAGEGTARTAKVGEATSFNVIGRALENKTTDDIGYVEAFVAAIK